MKASTSFQAANSDSGRFGGEGGLSDTTSPFHILSPSLSGVTKWLDSILSNLTVQHLAFGWRLVLVSPQVELASRQGRSKFRPGVSHFMSVCNDYCSCFCSFGSTAFVWGVMTIAFYIFNYFRDHKGAGGCVVVMVVVFFRWCYCFVSSMSVVGLQLAHWGCHYHSLWTWLLLKPSQNDPISTINCAHHSPVSNTREAWKCVLPSCLGGRALAGRLDGPGQENQGQKRGWILVRLRIHEHTNMLIYQVLLILDIQ